MFCPSCGSENTGLPYCNRCGANLSALTTQSQVVQVNVTKPAVILSLALVFLTLGGFAALILGALGLARVLQGNDSFMAVIFFGMIVILTVDIFLARQISKIISAALSSTSSPPTPRTGNSNRLPVPLQEPIGARLHAAPSVTENTTRFFEPAPTYRAPSETDELASAQEIRK